jgi:hypothetical protein
MMTAGGEDLKAFHMLKTLLSSSLLQPSIRSHLMDLFLPFYRNTVLVRDI